MSSYILLFFIIYEVVKTVAFYLLIKEEKIKNKKLDLYNEELNFELAKLRRK